MNNMSKFYANDSKSRKKREEAEDHAAAKFVRTHFYAKECNFYIPKRGNDSRCVCGASYENHAKNVKSASSSSVWREECIQKMPTNAFGRVNFLRADLTSTKPAKYVRLSDHSNLEDVITLFTRYWKLIDIRRPPEIVISVVGGATHFGLPDGLQKGLLDRELMKAVETTNGWLLTDGLDTGVATAIGKATRQSQSLMWNNSANNLRYTIQCIGISAWSSVNNRKELINRDLEKLNNAVYTPCVITAKGEKNLNPHHTHFLLVDDGFYKEELKAVADFRAKLEKQISQPRSKNGLDIPVICILIEGGIRSIERVAQSLIHGVSVLICDGTGRAADLLARACRQYDDILKFSDKSTQSLRLYDFRRSLPEIVASAFFSRYYETAETIEKLRRGKIGRLLDACVGNIWTVCEKRRLVSIFNVNGTATLDTAILLCLLECQKLERANQLRLALRWNRADVARAKIFTSAAAEDNRNVDHWSLFTSALINDQCEFVRLFVDYKLDVKSCLTMSELRKLYSKTMTANTLSGHIMKRHWKTRRFRLSILSQFLNHYTRRFHHVVYEKDIEGFPDDQSNAITFDHPFQELFLWAVLLGRQSLAKYFWEQCMEPLMTAIAGTFICTTLIPHAIDWSSTVKDDLYELKNDLETLAVLLIQKAYLKNVKKTMVLLHRKSEVWDNAYCMELAALAGDKAFLSTSACQQDIWDTWKCGFHARWTTIAISTFTLFPVLFLCKFRTDNEFEDPLDEDYLPFGKKHTQNGHDAQETAFLDENTSDELGEPQPKALLRHLSWLDSRSDASDVHVSPEEQPWWKKLQIFYTAPTVKFTYYTFFYLLYLLLYCYVILFSLAYRISNAEIIFQIWTYAMMCEEIYVIFKYPGKKSMAQVKAWWSYSSYAAWNRMDFFAPSLTCLAFVLRWFPNLFNFARLILCLNFIQCMFRLFKVYYVNNYLGPKVIMIKRMTWHLTMFVGILAVILVSYTVTLEAILAEHERSYFHGIFWTLFHHGVWVLFGELQAELDLVKFQPACLDANTTSFEKFDCTVKHWPPPILLAGYCFVGNILLVNMLIAVFAHVFQQVQSQSEQLWRYHMYFLVKEYKEKALLPPPFNVLEYIFRSFRGCWRKYHKLNHDSNKRFPSWKGDYEEYINAFENAARLDMLDQSVVSSGDSQIGNTLQELADELKSVASTLSAIQASIGARKISKDTGDRKASRDVINTVSIQRAASHEDRKPVGISQIGPNKQEFTPAAPEQAPTISPPMLCAFSGVSNQITGPILREAKSSPALSKAADQHQSNNGSERDSLCLDEMDDSMPRTGDGVLETFHDANE